MCDGEQRLSYFRCQKVYDQYLCSHSRLAPFLIFCSLLALTSINPSDWLSPWHPQAYIFASVLASVVWAKSSAWHLKVKQRFGFVAVGPKNSHYLKKNLKITLWVSRSVHLVKGKLSRSGSPFKRYQKVLFLQVDGRSWVTRGVARWSADELARRDKSYEIASVALKWGEVK